MMLKNQIYKTLEPDPNCLKDLYHIEVEGKWLLINMRRVKNEIKGWRDLFESAKSKLDKSAAPNVSQPSNPQEVSDE